MHPAAAPKICSEWRNTILAQKNIFAFAPGYADLEGGRAAAAGIQSRLGMGLKRSLELGYEWHRDHLESNGMADNTL